jgi:hypothetical protein
MGFFKKSDHHKHETWHAKQRAKERGICRKERSECLRAPDVVVSNGNKRELYKKSQRRQGLHLKAVIVVGMGSGGSAVVAGVGSIFGVGIGITVAVLTYYYICSSRVPQQDERKTQAS